MEDYDQFVQHRLAQLRESEDQCKRSSAPSLIRFYGRPILPPLLSEEQREEMQRHRQTAQKAAVHRKSRHNQRLAHVQTILHSVQLRNSPTLEELLQELKGNTKSSSSHDTSGESMLPSNSSIWTKDNLTLSPPLVMNGKDAVSLPPMSSTMCSAFFTQDVTPPQSCQGGCLNDQHDSQKTSQPSSFNGVSHWSASSGYATNENTENTPTLLGMVDKGRECHSPCSTGEDHTMGGLFLHNTSNTIAKMPDIISHPPIDGEELERNGIETSVCSHSELVKDTCCSFLQEDSVTCETFPGANPENSLAQNQDNLPPTAALDLGRDQNSETVQSPVPLLECSGSSDNPELTRTSSSHPSPMAELHIQPDLGRRRAADNQGHEGDSKPSAQSCRLSLQALLKKSQEYRRRQRMLRNQAKNTKIQERAQEQPRVEEQSLSDKENDEIPYRGTIFAEEKKTKEKRGTFFSSMETLRKTLWENDRLIENDLLWEKWNCKPESTCLIGDGNIKGMAAIEEDSALKKQKLDVSQVVVMEPKQSITSVQQQLTSTDTTSIQKSFYVSSERSATCATAVFKGVSKYHIVPALKICRSPVHCSGKSRIKDGDATTGTDATEEKVLVLSSFGEDHKVDEGSNSGSPNGDVTSVFAKSSEHINLLESNLFSLKELISDLESTLTETSHPSHSQSQSSLHSEQMKDDQQTQLGQSDCDKWEEKLMGDYVSDAEPQERHGEWLRRQGVDTCKNMHKDERPEPSNSDTDVPLMQRQKGNEVNLAECRLVKTSERKKNRGTDKERLTKGYGQHGGYRKQQPPAKCIFSVAQQMHIPNFFRNVPSGPPVSHNVAVLSDTSNHPLERRSDLTMEGHDSVHSLSLNESFDVDSPSGLWLLEQSGSDVGSNSHLVQEKRLTPESADKSEGGVSKVKRRLLMHVTEDALDRSSDTSGRASSVVRPNSSTPRAATWWCEDRDKQEQLKQAQIRALQEELRRQQEEPLQALAVRYRLLQSVSFPCSMSSSHLGDTLTFSTVSQPSCALLVRYRPLLFAAVKGFLTRRLLRTERVAQLVRTIRDTQQFLQAFQQQSPGRGDMCSRQDLLLQERVTLQLRAARYEVHDIFFSLSVREKMQLISWDRELVRERELRRQTGHARCPRGKSSLSAATQKALERKRGIIIQKKAAERHKGTLTTGCKSGVSAEQPPETKRGQFRANPQRVPKSTYSFRPR